MKQDALNRLVYSISRNKTENDLNQSCKNYSKYGPARIKQVRDSAKISNWFNPWNTEFSYIAM